MSYGTSSSVVYSTSPSAASVGNELSQLAIQPDVSPSSQPITTQGMQSTRPNHQSTSRVRPTSIESRYSSSSEAFGSTSSLDNELSQLVIEHNIYSSSKFPRAESYSSSSSHVFSSSSSLDNEFSQLVIEHDNPPSSQFVRSQSYYSSSREAFSSSSSLDNQLSQLAIEHEQPPFSQLTQAESYNSRQQRDPAIPPLRPATAASYCSSSSEVLSSVSDSLDVVFSQPTAGEETQPSSQSTQSTQPHQPVTKITQTTRLTDSSISMAPVRELETDGALWAYDSDSDSQSSTEPPVYGSPSSTGKLSNSHRSSTPSPTRSTPHPTPSTSTSSPRLYRTRSGELATLAELRQRKQREEEALDSALKGIKIPRGPRKQSKRLVPMRLNESGRWRIDSIREPWSGP